MSENRCLVCGAREWGTICNACGADGWTDKRVLQALVDVLRAR